MWVLYKRIRGVGGGLLQPTEPGLGNNLESWRHDLQIHLYGPAITPEILLLGNTDNHGILGSLGGRSPSQAGGGWLHGSFTPPELEEGSRGGRKGFRQQHGWAVFSVTSLLGLFLHKMSLDGASPSMAEGWGG